MAFSSCMKMGGNFFPPERFVSISNELISKQYFNLCASCHWVYSALTHSWMYIICYLLFSNFYSHSYLAL